MSIIIAANTSWYLSNFRGTIIKTLLNRGYEVIALSPEDAYTGHVKVIGAQHFNLKLNNSGTNPFKEIQCLTRLFFQVHKLKPALLLTYTPKINIYFSFVARMLKVPIVANVSGLGTGFLSGGLIKLVVVFLYRVAFKYPQKIYFQNLDDQDYFISLKLVVPEKTERIPGSGVNLNLFAPVEKVTNNHTIFLMAARLLWDKGVNEFIEASRMIKIKYPDSELLLIGFLDVQNPTAVSRADVDSWESEGIIRYLGSTDDVRSFYSTADCIVLPSYREGIPRSLLEASSMAIPIITTNVAGCKDVVENGKTGFLCKVKDAGDLALKMEMMINLSPEQRIAMGKAGREKMEREFDERFVIERYMSTVKEILQNKL